MTEERDQQWAHFDRIGEVAVRKEIGSGLMGASVIPLAREWLEHKASLRAAEANATALAEARAAVSEARTANSEAKTANLLAKEANAIAWKSNIIAITALVVAIIAIAISILGVFAKA